MDIGLRPPVIYTRAHPESKYSFFTHRTFAQRGKKRAFFCFVWFASLPIWRMCTLIGLSRASRHKWNKAAPVTRTQAQRGLAKKKFFN